MIQIHDVNVIFTLYTEKSRNCNISTSVAMVCIYFGTKGIGSKIYNNLRFFSFIAHLPHLKLETMCHLQMFYLLIKKLTSIVDFYSFFLLNLYCQKWLNFLYSKDKRYLSIIKKGDFVKF